MTATGRRGAACCAPAPRTSTSVPLALREGPPKYDASTPRELPRESVLHEVWEAQRYPKGTLALRDGAPVRVVYRGLPGLGPGPDFRNAIVKLPGGLAQGDVELHVRAGDFYRHGHHLDPAYDGVALHVVFLDDTREDTVLASGRRVPVATLPLPGPGRLPAPYGEPCRGAVARAGAGAVGETLDRLGAMRFRRLAFLSRQALRGGPPEDLLWRRVLEALSYGSSPLGPLAVVLTWSELRAGLLSLPPSARAAAAHQQLTARHDFKSSEMRRSLLPGNRPGRRLEGAAVLAARFAGDGLAASLLAGLDEDGALPRLLGALTVPGLIGRARAVEIAANAVLPLAAALTGEPPARRYEALFAALPLPARYGAVRHLHAALGPAVKPSARRQQGMLYLLRQYCTQGGCGRCPLS